MRLSPVISFTGMLQRVTDATLQTARPLRLCLEFHPTRIDLVDVVVDEQSIGRIRLLCDEIVDVVIEARGGDTKPTIEIVLDDDFPCLIRLRLQARVRFGYVALPPVQLVRIGCAERFAIEHLERRRFSRVVDQRQPRVGRSAEAVVTIVADAQVQEKLRMEGDLVLRVQSPVLGIPPIVEVLVRMDSRS